jgi:catalase (peroxidase I)
VQYITNAVCPGLLQGTPFLNGSDDDTIPSEEVYNAALPTLDIPSVFEDLYELLYDSQECWPADEFSGESKASYAGLFLRLAWHCAGTFRDTDSAGGCAGGRQRYESESSMDDNVNLDKARALLSDIKDTYGDALSWGDLFVFAGTAAILAGGGPVTMVCAGRIDDVNGDASDVLFDDSTCNIQGNCSAPLGSAQVGLIYVDASGYLGQPDPVITAPHIREVFSRMGMNDSETVALIGGGHAFGKAHGACTEGPGLGPDEAPYNPWPGNCGTDFPSDVFTSGFEGQWTEKPFTWDNEYFIQLRDDNYTLVTSSGGNPQWTNLNTGYFMLTTDLALRNDDIYIDIVNEFASNQDSLDRAFEAAWEKLVTSGGNWANNTRCIDASDLEYSSTNFDMSTTENSSEEDSAQINNLNIYNYVLSFFFTSILFSMLK